MNNLTANIGWQNANSTRNYPLVDLATRIDKYGKLLPNDILVDFRMWTNLDNNTRYFIGSLCVSPQLISMTVLDEDQNLLATLVLDRTPPVTVYRNHKLNANVEGVAAWVAFGPGINEITSTSNWVFDELEATELLPRLAQSYLEYGVTGIARVNRSNALSGVVKLSSSTPELLSIRFLKASDSQAIEINGNAVNAIVLDLNEEAEGINIHGDFIGPCEGTPESNTCRLPAIFTLNDVQPDCSGVLHFLIDEEVDPDLGALLELETADGSIRFNFNFGLGELCARSRLPFDNPQLIKPECYDPCESLNVGPFDGYDPLYGGSL